MKILYIDVNCKGSSTGKIVYDLYTQGRADGHEAAVCYGRGPLVEEENIFKFGLDQETNFHALMTRLTGLTGCWSHFSTRRLLRFLDEFRPDVVHIHELHAYFVDLAPLFRYLRENDIPVVYTFHCEFAYTGKCGYAYECERWKTGCGHCPKLREYPRTLFLDFTARMLRQKRAQLEGLGQLIITAPSGWLADRARQSFLRDREIRVVHNGIDTEGVFYPRPAAHLRQRHSLTDEKVVLAVAPGLMSARKGGRWVVRLAEAMQGERVRFVLVGVDDLTEAFPPNVTALGRTADQQELAAYYALADCFVICSEKENFPTTCLEAFCCGTPVAGFAAGGTAETVPAPYGRFCGYGDVEQLRRLVLQQLQTPASREEIAGEGRRRYSQARMYEAYRDIYQKLLQEKQDADRKH